MNNKLSRNRFFNVRTKHRTCWWIVLLLIIIAYSSSVVVRFNWVKTYSKNDNMKWQGNNLLISPDSYWYAKGVKDILSGETDVNKSPIKHGFSQFGALLCRITGMTPEVLLFYLTIFITPLLVVPIILLGSLKKMPFLGFFASLLAVNSQALLMRTKAGVFDTDMFALIMPTFIIYLLLLAGKKQKLWSSLFLLISISFSLWVYPESLYLILLIQISYFIYLLAGKKADSGKLHILQTTLIICLNLSIWIRLLLLFTSFFLYYLKQLKRHRLLLVKGLLVISFLVYIPFFLIRLDNDNFLDDINNLSQHSSKLDKKGSEEQFTDVNKTISELQKPGLSRLFHDGFGNKFYIIASVLGIIVLLLGDSSFLLFLPLLIFGFSSLFAGMRFFAYMVPVLSLGSLYFIYFCTHKITRRSYLFLIVALLASGFFLYISYQKTRFWVKQAAVEKETAEQLSKLGESTSSDDYVISWWDYGYVLKYFTGMNTVADGTVQQGEINKLLSNIILGNDQELAVNMAAAVVEYHKAIDPPHTRKQPSVVEYLLNKYDVSSLDLLISEMKQDNFPRPALAEDVYLYFPFEMLKIIQAIGLFSDKPDTNEHFLFISHAYDQGRFRLRLAKNVAWDQTTNLIYFENIRYPLKFYSIIEEDDNGKLTTKTAYANPAGSLSIIFIRSKNMHIIVNDKTIVSNFFQIGILDNYKKELLDQVVNDEMMKVYKIKK